MMAFAGTYLSDLGQGHLHTPELPLVPEAVLSDQLQLTIKTLLLEGTPWLLERFSICNTARVSEHGCCALPHSGVEYWEMLL